MLLALRRAPSWVASRAAPAPSTALQVVVRPAVSRYVALPALERIVPSRYPGQPARTGLLILSPVAPRGGGRSASVLVDEATQDARFARVSRYDAPSVTRQQRPTISRYAGATSIVKVGPRVDKLLGLPIPSAPLLRIVRTWEPPIGGQSVGISEPLPAPVTIVPTTGALSFVGFAPTVSASTTPAATADAWIFRRLSRVTPRQRALARRR